MCQPVLCVAVVSDGCLLYGGDEPVRLQVETSLTASPTLIFGLRFGRDLKDRLSA